MSGSEHMEAPLQDPVPQREESAAATVVVIALSAGGLRPLRTLVRALPRDLPAAVVIAQHLNSWTLLPSILALDTSLPVALAADGELLRSGRIYVCPPRRHAVVNPDATVALSDRERLHFFRPNVDWLFTSTAASFRERAVAVVLSGMQHDGAAGVTAIQRAGGWVCAQSLDTCERPDMPLTAISSGSVHAVAAPAEIGRLIAVHLENLNVARCRALWDDPFAFQS